MITIKIPRVEPYNEDTNTFGEPIKATTLVMEHSLISIRKWERKWKIPFLHSEKTDEQLIDYLRFMTLTKNVDERVYFVIPPDEMKRLGEYMKDMQTAMTFKSNLIGAQKHSSEFVSAETIYYWMITLGIPIQFEKWHLGELLALIKFVNEKNDPNKKKMSQKEVIQRYAEINERNRKRFNSKG